MTQGTNGPDSLSPELPPETEARMLAALRSLGEPRAGAEMDDATMLARVLAAASGSLAVEPQTVANGSLAMEPLAATNGALAVEPLAAHAARAGSRGLDGASLVAGSTRGDASAGAPVIPLPGGAGSSGGDTEAPRSPGRELVRPRSRPAFRRTVAAAFAGFAIAATVAYAAQQYVRSHDTPPAPPTPTEAPAPSSPPRLHPIAVQPAPAPSETATTSEDDAPSTTATAAPEDSAQPPAPSAAPAPQPTADDLLKRAQKLYTAGDIAGATAAYRALVARYPGSGEAHAALISLGQLALAGGRAEEALADFNRYLAGSGGPLSTEARVGRIGALRALGRTSEERAAIEDFLARSGNGVHAARLRARLAEITGP